MTKQEFINASREFIASGKTDKALTFMRTEVGNFDPDLVKDIILLENRYTKSTSDFNTGDLSRENYEPIVAQITLALLDFLEKLEKSAPLSIGTVKNKNSGRILHNIPGMMPVGVERKCIVRIAYDDEALLRDMQTDENTTIQSIRIAEVMGVELIDDNETPAFSIRTITEEEQSIVTDDYTQWLFKVKALREGRFPLTLKVAVIEEVNGKERKRDIVLEKEVFIISQIEPAPAPAAPSPVVVKENQPQALETGFEDSTIRFNYVSSDDNRGVAATTSSKRFSVSGITSTIAVIVMALTGWVAFQKFSTSQNVNLPNVATNDDKNGQNKGSSNGQNAIKTDTSLKLAPREIYRDTASQLANIDNKNNPSKKTGTIDNNTKPNEISGETKESPKIEAMPKPYNPNDKASPAKKSGGQTPPTGSKGNGTIPKSSSTTGSKGNGTTSKGSSTTGNKGNGTNGKGKPSVKPNNTQPKGNTDIPTEPTPDPSTQPKIKIGDITIGTQTDGTITKIEPEAEVKTYKVYLILKGEMKKAQISVDGQPVDQYLKKNFWGSRQYIEFKSSKTKHSITFKKGNISCTVTDVLIENGNMSVEPCSFEN